jgi:hypothetical protein
MEATIGSGLSLPDRLAACEANATTYRRWFAVDVPADTER